MAMDSAKSFVNKFFEDDEFIREFYKNGGFISSEKGSKPDTDAQNAKMVEVAGKMGYDFTMEEYQAANKEYVDSVGAWKSMKKMVHMARTVKKLEKEAKKANK